MNFKKISCFIILTIICHQIKSYQSLQIAGLTAYVDKTLGNDLNCKLENPLRPCQTFNKTITMITKLNFSNEYWTIIARSGYYNELVTLPKNVNIYGSGDSTILNGLIIRGTSEIKYISIQTVDIIALIINANDENVYLFQVSMNTLWSSPNEKNNILIENLSGITIISNCQLNGIVSTNINMASFFYIEKGELNFNNVNIITQVTGNVPYISLFMCNGIQGIPSDDTNFRLDYSYAQLQVINVASKVTFLNTNNVNSEIFTSRLNFNIKNALTSSFLTAKAGVTVKITNTALNFKAPPPNLVMAEGISDLIGNIPDVRITGCSFIKTPIPPIEGEFSSYTYAITSTQGFISNGGLQLGIKIIITNYTIQPEDAFLLVNRDNIYIKIPNPNLISIGTVSSGRLIYIINNSNKKIFIIGESSIFPISIKSKRTLQLVSDNINWYKIRN